MSAEFLALCIVYLLAGVCTTYPVIPPRGGRAGVCREPESGVTA